MFDSFFNHNIMKRYFLFSIAIFFACLAHAQDYASIKNIVALQQYKSAKEKFDSAAKNAQFTAKPEAYLLKASIYAGLATDPAIKGSATEEALLKTADMAFTEFKMKDPSLPLLNDAVYQNAVINLYSGLYTSGYKEYQDKNWNAGLQTFKKVIEYSDLLINKKLLGVSIDTNALILAGIVAENAGAKDEAAKYYGRLADAKISGEGFETVYRFLVTYYFTKKDMAGFEKYKALGKTVYPKSEYFNYDKVDFAAGLETDWNKKIAALEELLAADPDNGKANQVLGEMMFDTLKTTHTIPTGTAAQWETKMITAFNKSATANPNSTLPLLYIGNYFIQKAINIQEAMVTTTNKEELTKQYTIAFNSAREPYEKAVAIYSVKKDLSNADKQQYKNIVAYLYEIYKFNNDGVGAKKWNDFYNALR